MKKFKFFLCAMIYCAVFLFTITAQYMFITNSRLRTALNLSTLILTSVSVKAIIMLMHEKSAKSENDSVTSHEQETEIFVAKEEFSDYAARHSLSKRETETAWLVYNGLTNQQIADEIYVSLVTVKKHVTHIYEKCNVSCRKEFKENIKSFVRKQHTTSKNKNYLI